ncbi:hypothetical protein Tsubulata_034409 [Turnera subulata]|uniref:NAC domain-containing protein n=1 Tax=Turnera subulata TaxID=218843 RepID=A0A9Q0JRE8_9ROSI|nr:hypothetical protein Tsubulata_034409 [Turnera subulata]
MAQVLPRHPTPSPLLKSSNRRPKRKRSPEEEDDDGGGGGGPRLATATAPVPAPPPLFSDLVPNSLSSCSKDPYVMALEQFGVHLPSGYYFTPSIDELVGYYLLRKINGTLRPIDVALIPDCDVYGDEEPWEKLTRLKKRSRRIGTNGGTWHEDTKKRHPVTGMIIKAVERQFSYRNLSSPNCKLPWLLKEFTLDNYAGNFAVCELRKKSCNTAVGSSDSGSSLSSHPANDIMMPQLSPQSDPAPLPSHITDLVEESEFEAELDDILTRIDFSGCEDIPSTPTSTSQLETDDVSPFLVPGKDEGLINIEAYHLESLGDVAELQLVYDGALTSSDDLELAPPKADDREHAPWMSMLIRSSCREQPPIQMVPLNSILPDPNSSLC